MLGRAVGFRGRRFVSRLRLSGEPVRRVQLPGALSARVGTARVPVHEPRVSGRRARVGFAPGGARAVRLRRCASAPGCERGGYLGALSAYRGANALRCDEARRRASDRGVRSDLRPEVCGRPVRRSGRALADGKVRSGGLRVLDGSPHSRQEPPVPGLRRVGQAGEGRPTRCGPGRAHRGSVEPAARLGRGDGERRGRFRPLALAARDDAALSRDLGSVGRGRGGVRRSARRCADLRERLQPARRAHPVAPAPELRRGSVRHPRLADRPSRRPADGVA